MNKDFRLAFDVLDKIFREGAYSNIILGEVIDKSDNRGLLTKIVYGVVENNVNLEYFLNKIVPSRPQKKVSTILKLGMYMLRYLDSVPDHAVVFEMVDLATYANKKSQAGFVNAVLKKCIGYDYQLPEDKKERLSVEYSVPMWIVNAYFKQYGEEIAIGIIKTKAHTLEHIRPNTKYLSYEKLAVKLADEGIAYSESGYGGYYVQNNPVIGEFFQIGDITFQSPSSMVVVKATGISDGDNVLDICSAPGGKAVYMSELAKNVSIIATDIHPHRVKQIRDYAERMDVNCIDADVMDATVRNYDYIEKFDIVLADVPCSGLGVAGKKADIYLSKTMDGVNELAEIQYAILQNAIDYTKVGGVIIYSTCTTLREENYNIIGKTLKLRDDVSLEVMDIDIENKGFIQLLPDGKGLDGFFIARLRKC